MTSSTPPVESRRAGIEAAPEAPAAGTSLLDRADESLSRLAIGLAASLFLHVVFLAVVLLTFGVERGGDETYLTVSLGPSGPADTDDEESRDRLAEANQNVQPIKPQDETAEELDVQERTERLAASLAEAEAQAEREFHRVAAQAQADREAQRAARLAGLQQIDEAVSGNLERRGGMPSLEPNTFYGLKVHTRRVIFVLDISGSMDIEFAKLNLRNAYADLDENAYFGIVLYNHEILTWKKHLVRASKETKASADQFLAPIKAGGATNIYDALREAFEISADSITRADTIYFLTDGLPNRGKVIEPEGILAALRRWNADERVIVHAIQILGPMAQNQVPQEKIDEARDFMRRLAREHNGVYVERD